MSGEETLAQVNREIEHPKLKNLEKTGLVIFIYSLLFTSLVSFFAVMIIPDSVRPDYFANLIGGIAMYLVGPHQLEAAVPWLRGAGGSADSGGCAEYFHRRRQRRSESRGRRWRAHQLVPEAASPLRHELSHHQSDRLHAVAYHRPQPRRRIPVGRALCFRRDLEFRHEVAGRAGVALHRAGKSRSGKFRAICTSAKRKFRWD